MRRIVLAIVVVVLLTGLTSTAKAAGPTDEEKSVVSCQIKSGKILRNFQNDYLKIVGGCLLTVVKSKVGGTGNVLRACLKLAEVDTSNGIIFHAGLDIATVCIPGHGRTAHSEDDITGMGSPGVRESLGVHLLENSCGHQVLTVGDWDHCLMETQERALLCQLTPQFPKALEWFAIAKATVDNDPDTEIGVKNGIDYTIDRLSAAIDGTPSGDNVPDINCFGP